jgi:hypothetical protein
LAILAVLLVSLVMPVRPVAPRSAMRPPAIASPSLIEAEFGQAAVQGRQSGRKPAPPQPRQRRLQRLGLPRSHLWQGRRRSGQGSQVRMSSWRTGRVRSAPPTPVATVLQCFNGRGGESCDLRGAAQSRLCHLIAFACSKASVIVAIPMLVYRTGLPVLRVSAWVWAVGALFALLLPMLSLGNYYPGDLVHLDQWIWGRDQLSALIRDIRASG